MSCHVTSSYIILYYVILWNNCFKINSEMDFLSVNIFPLLFILYSILNQFHRKNNVQHRLNTRNRLAICTFLINMISFNTHPTKLKTVWCTTKHCYQCKLVNELLKRSRGCMKLQIYTIFHKNFDVQTIYRLYWISKIYWFTKV